MRHLVTILLIIMVLSDVLAQTPISIQKLEQSLDSILKNNKPEAKKWISTKIIELLPTKDDWGLAFLSDKLADLKRTEGLFDEAILILEQNIPLKEKLGDEKFYSETHTILGKTYANKGDYEKALTSFLKALNLLEKIGDKRGIAFSLNNIAIIYDLQKNYFKAMKYYEKSVAIKVQLKDSSGLAAGYNNLAITFFNLKDIQKSIEWHLKSLHLNKLLKREEPMARSLNNLGYAFNELKNHSRAIEYLNEALDLRIKFANSKDIATTCNNLAMAWLAKANLDSAQHYNLLALNTAKKINSFSLLKDVYTVKSDIETLKKNYALALSYKDSLIMYKDSLINEGNINAVAEMEARYEYEKMKREIGDKNLDILYKDKKIRDANLKMSYWIIGTLIFVFLFALSFVILISTRKKKEVIYAQKLLIEKQNNDLQKMNAVISEELDKSVIGLEQKNNMLNLFYKEQSNIDLPPELLNLSKREIEVLSHLALGWSDQEIAEFMFVSKATVKSHLRRIYSKLLVKGRAEAVSIAHKYKIIGITSKETNSE